ncbi:MAG: PorT family protein [Chlorobi bacterium]|nr:PorT family protein [Chlorobiota bacterium]
MNSDKKNIDQLFENVLKGYREKPSPGAWNRLGRNLDGMGPKRTVVFLKWMAAAVLVLFAFGSGYFYAVYNISDDSVADNATPAVENFHIPEINDDMPIVIDEAEDNLKEGNKDEIQMNEKVVIPQKTTAKNEKLVADNNKLPKNMKHTSLSNSEEDIENNEIASISVTSKDVSEDMIEILPVQNNEIFISEPVEVNQVEETKLETAELAQVDFFDKSGIPDGFGGKKGIESKWGIGARVAPIQSYREISFAGDENFTQGVVAESNFNDREGKLNSYAGGVDVRYQISSKWSFQSGVYFSRIGQVNNDALAFKQENNNFMLFKVTTSTGEIDIAFDKIPDDIKSFSDTKDTTELKISKDIRVEQTFDLFEVPFLIGYKIGNRKLTLNLAGGFSPAYVVNNSSTLIADEQKHDIGSSANINSMIVNSSFSLGIQYAFTKKLALNFEPTFKYSLNPINKDNRFNYHPYSLTWFTGVRYSF